MASLGTATWTGASGTKYEYTIHPVNEVWNDVPGNYIFARYNPNTRRYEALYIGQTSSLKNRLVSSHEALPCAGRNSMTHIHAHANYNGEAARLLEEKDLIDSNNPPCNG